MDEKSDENWKNMKPGLDQTKKYDRDAVLAYAIRVKDKLIRTGYTDPNILESINKKIKFIQNGGSLGELWEQNIQERVNGIRAAGKGIAKLTKLTRLRDHSRIKRGS